MAQYDVEKLDKYGWGIFLIFVGMIIIFPDATFPDGTFLLGIGIILLGINFIKYSKKLPISKFTIFIGLIALLSGLTTIYGFDLDIIPIILILWGLSLIFGHKKKL